MRGDLKKRGLCYVGLGVVMFFCMALVLLISPSPTDYLSIKETFSYKNFRHIRIAVDQLSDEPQKMQRVFQIYSAWIYIFIAFSSARILSSFIDRIILFREEEIIKNFIKI